MWNPGSKSCQVESLQGCSRILRTVSDIEVAEGEHSSQIKLKTIQLLQVKENFTTVSCATKLHKIESN